MNPILQQAMDKLGSLIYGNQSKRRKTMNSNLF